MITQPEDGRDLVHVAYELSPQYAHKIVENTYSQTKWANTLEMTPDGLVGAVMWALVLIFVLIKLVGII